MFLQIGKTLEWEQHEIYDEVKGPWVPYHFVTSSGLDNILKNLWPQSQELGKDHLFQLIQDARLRVSPLEPKEGDPDFRSDKWSIEKGCRWKVTSKDCTRGGFVFPDKGVNCWWGFPKLYSPTQVVCKPSITEWNNYSWWFMDAVGLDKELTIELPEPTLLIPAPKWANSTLTLVCLESEKEEYLEDYKRNVSSFRRGFASR